MAIEIQAKNPTIQMGIQGPSGGGGQVQPDWNQNDETAKDYVKNRPFYTGNPVETVLVEESTVSFADNGGLYTANFPSTVEATVGETYKVSWDGIVYECTSVSVEGLPVIGNLAIIGGGSDTGEPFIIGIQNGERITIYTTDTSASHTISISGFSAPEVVKIDEKYIPTIPADKLPTIPADKLPTIPVIEFTTKISDSIANSAQPSFTVSNLSYSEIYSIVEKGYFQIKDTSGISYRPIKCFVDSSGVVVDILVFSPLGTIYASLACNAGQMMFYRNNWWQIEATQK